MFIIPFQIHSHPVIHPINLKKGRDIIFGLDGSGFEPPVFAREFLFSTPVQTHPGAHPESYSIGTGALC
jgi:hypothetical protein